MSHRNPAVLRDDSGQNLRDYLIETAARLIDQRGSAGLAVRDIAREAKVADGVLYNYFEDKEDLLVHALLAHVGNVMASAPRLLPPPGESGLGRIAAAAEIEAAASLIVGAMHGQILPRVLFAPPGTPVTIPAGLSARLADVVLQGIAPGARQS